MAIAALVIYLVWALLAFGLRSLLQWRRTGDTGWCGTGLRPGTLQWWARILFTGALLIGAAGPIAGLAGLLVLGGVGHPAVRVAGVVVAALGVLATLAAQTSMGASWRIGVDEHERTTLVTSGPSRWGLVWSRAECLRVVLYRVTHRNTASRAWRGPLQRLRPCSGLGVDWSRPSLAQFGGDEVVAGG